MTMIECFSPEGVPLYIEVQAAQATITMEASTYKTSVSASDFVPPATPQEMPTA